MELIICDFIIYNDKTCVFTLFLGNNDKNIFQFVKIHLISSKSMSSIFIKYSFVRRKNMYGEFHF